MIVSFEEESFSICLEYLWIHLLSRWPRFFEISKKPLFSKIIGYLKWYGFSRLQVIFKYFLWWHISRMMSELQFGHKNIATFLINYFQILNFLTSVSHFRQGWLRKCFYLRANGWLIQKLSQIIVEYRSYRFYCHQICWMSFSCLYFD